MLPDSLQPAQLLWGLFALPIVALYYWTFRRQRENVATYALWISALARRSPWSRWRQPVSLAVQLSLLALLVMSLAGLDWSPFARGARNVVLVIDVSASMKASDVPPNRFGQSLAEARRMVASLARDERAAIISAGSQPRVHCGLTGERRRLNQILDSLTCGDEPGRIESAIDLAERILEPVPNGNIVVLTDGRFAGASTLAAKKNVHLRIAGGKASNVAITRLAARPSLVASQHEVLVEAANFSSQPTTVRVELSLSGTKVETISFELAVGEAKQSVITANLAGGGLLTARLDPPDDFPADDSAVALVTPRRDRKVTLVGDERSPLAAALRSMPLVTVTIAADLSQPMPPADLTVLDGLMPLVLPAGPVLAIAPSGPCDLWEIDGSVEGRVEVKSQSGEPPLAGVDLSEAVIEELVRLKFNEPARTLAMAASGNPLVSLVERPTGRVLVWHARLDKSDLVQRRAWPLFVAQAFQWLAGSAPAESLAYQTGQRVSLPTAKSAQQLQSPRGVERELPGEANSSAALGEAGVWKMSDLVVPVNLFDPRESDLAIVEEISAGNLARSRPWLDEPLWTAFLALALVLTVADWFLLHRRTLV